MVTCGASHAAKFHRPPRLELRMISANPQCRHGGLAINNSAASTCAPRCDGCAVMVEAGNRPPQHPPLGRAMWRQQCPDMPKKGKYENGQIFGHWGPLLAAADCCCSVVKTPAEASTEAHFTARGAFGRTLNISGQEAPALPLPIAPAFYSPASCLACAGKHVAHIRAARHAARGRAHMQELGRPNHRPQAGRRRGGTRTRTSS